MRIISGSLFLFSFLIGFLLLVEEVSAQTTIDSNLIQFSGIMLDGSNEELIPLPYVNIFVSGKNRGTFSDLKGFFSIVVEKGDKIEFTAIGYKSAIFTIPDTLKELRYSVVQLMTQDTVNLPETVIFPWPSREHFKLEFLAMDVSNELQQRALENVAERSLRQMRNAVSTDGDEHSDFYLRQQARSYYYIGQTPPMNIFNPLAWKDFFDAWKAGEFKKKK